MKNKKIDDLQAVTILILIINILIYEIGFCNFNDITSNGTYNFSLFRIVAYIVFALLYIKFSNKFTNEANKVFESKKKIIYIYLILSIVYIIYRLFAEKYIYAFILTILAILNGLLLILYITKDYIKNIIVTILTVGIVFSISTTYYHIVDEKKHFLSALNVSVGNLDFEEAVANEEFNNIKLNSPAVNFALDFFNKNTSFEMKEIPQDESIYSTPADYSPILYLPSSIGINIARLLKGSVADIFIAGRVANTIAYGILLIIIFKLLPFKKDVFYSMYLIPMVFALSGSYSADAITIGIVGVFIAYVLKLYKENYDKINIKQYCILLALFGCVLLCKHGVYLGIIALIFILPIIKIVKSNKKILNLTVIIILVALFLGLYQGSKIINDTEGDVRVEETNPSKQVEFLIENPTNILKVYGNYLKQSLLNLNWYRGFNLKVFCGESYSMITFMLFIYVLYIAITDSSHTFKNKDKIVMFLTFGITFFITTFVLYLAYTNVGELTINGYQARYLIVLMPLILMNINTKKISPNYIDTSKYNKTALCMGIFTILDLLSIIAV